MLNFLVSGLGSLVTGMLGSAQLSSLWRKGLLAAAVALLSKYGIANPEHLVEVVGAAVLGVSSVAGSVKAHMDAKNQSVQDAIQDAANTAAQAAIAAALPALLQQMAMAPVRAVTGDPASV